MYGTELKAGTCLVFGRREGLEERFKKEQVIPAQIPHFVGKFCSCISEYHKCSDEEGQSSKKESSHMNSGACKKPSCAVFP